ncbi:MAG: hypothetical protein KJZ83_00490 [Burkholderiaceae bacterium]|nr:hypothetical protein [Burkholderiaceae bacterium]
MIKVISFAFKKGPPGGVDHVFDCRVLWNPHHNPKLRDLTGLDERVQVAVMRDFKVLTIIQDALAVAGSGKTIAFGCYGGKHRSVVVAEQVAEALEKSGHKVTVIHRELGSGRTTV